MSKLTTEIQECGLCTHCGKKLETVAISEKEAKEILDLIKGEFIREIKKKGLISDIDLYTVVEVIEGVS